MLDGSTLTAFLATTDGKRARQFYGEILSFTIVSDDPYALVCETSRTSLRIQKVGAFRPQPFTALGWEVPDIAAAIDGLAKRGVAFERYEGMDQDERGIWKAPSGARVAWFKDPDGNVLSLTQT